jgi:hypothetical protein
LLKKNVQPFFNAIQRGKRGQFNEKSTIQSMKVIQDIIEDTPHNQWFKEEVY